VRERSEFMRLGAFFRGVRVARAEIQQRQDVLWDLEIQEMRKWMDG